jgi:3-oxoacyl-[acyl-carrier protein] reductase
MHNGRRQPLAGQTALVTGAVRRIGRSIALALAEEGAKVVINARSSRDEAEAVAEEVRTSGGQALVCISDVTDENQVRDMFDEITGTFGSPRILVNNAAIRRQTPFTEMPYKEWREIMGVILDGAFLCCRAALPGMVEAGYGRIINIGGMTAHIGAHHRAHVVAAKAGIVGLTKALAVEFAAAGITANCVVPGRIGGERSSTSGGVVTLAGTNHPLVGREGKPEDVSAVVRMLSLPSSDYMTGQTIHISGGLVFP